MKRLLLLLAMVCLSASAFGTTFTAQASGDWESATVWGTTAGLGVHITYPGMTDLYSAGPTNGDVVIIPDKYVITCANADVICSAGASPSSTTSYAITVTSGSTHVGGIFVCGTVATSGTGWSCAGGTAAKFVIAGNIEFTGGASTWVIDTENGSSFYVDSSWASTPTTAYVSCNKCVGGAGIVMPFVFNGTSANHVTVDGDAYDSPLACRLTGAGCNTNCATVGSCISGIFGYPAQASGNEGGCLTATYTDFIRFNWSGKIFTQCAWNVTHSTFTKSGSYAASMPATGSTANWTLTNASFTGCRAGCYSLASTGTYTGTYLLQHVAADSSVTLPGTAYTQLTGQDILISSAANNGNSGQQPGFTSNPPNASFDQLLIYDNASTTGGTDGSYTGYFPVGATSNSVLWVEDWMQTSAHRHAFANIMTTGPTTSKYLNNVIGSMGGNIGSGTNDTLTADAWQSPASSNTTWLFQGNVSLCGANGLTSAGLLHLTNTAFTSGSNVFTIENNTACSAVFAIQNGSSIGTQIDENGTVSFESISGTFAGVVATMDSNLFHSPIHANPVEEVSGPGSGTTTLTGLVTVLKDNGVFNTNTATAAVQYGTNTGIGAAAWVSGGPTGDITNQARNAVLVEATRSVPLFDTEYLCPAGILGSASSNCDAYYATDPQWQSTWSSGHGTYNVGDVVEYNNASYFGNLHTYWRCIQQHASSTAASQPIVGYNNSQIYYGYGAYWELAYLKYARTAVSAGIVYYEGAVPQLTNTAGTAQPLYFPGLLNAWLRQGMRSMETTLWGACLVSTNNPYGDCGFPDAPITHMAAITAPL